MGKLKVEMMMKKNGVNLDEVSDELRELIEYQSEIIQEQEQMLRHYGNTIDQLHGVLYENVSEEKYGEILGKE